jgi:hypothetical protein
MTTASRATGLALLLSLGLLAAACSSAKHTFEPPPSTTTTAPASAATTSTTGALTNGTDDASVLTRLQNVATAELVLYTDNQMVSASAATLTNVEPGVTYGQGLTPPTNPVEVNVAVSADAQYACLTGQSASGRVYVLVVGPPANVYEGFMALTVCDAAVVQHLKLVTG